MEGVGASPPFFYPRTSQKMFGEFKPKHSLRVSFTSLTFIHQIKRVVANPVDAPEGGDQQNNQSEVSLL